MVFWRGFGILLVPLVLLCNLLASGVAAAFGADVNSSGEAYAWAGLTLAAIATYLLEKYWLAPRREKRTRQLVDPKTKENVTVAPVDSLFFIQVKHWPIVLVIFAAIAGIAALS